jgi:hypothetical protein
VRGSLCAVRAAIVEHNLARNVAGGQKGATMKTLFCLLGILAGMSVIGTSAHAQNYPWCAYYGKDSGTNCGFTTFEQMPGGCQRYRRLL